MTEGLLYHNYNYNYFLLVLTKHHNLGLGLGLITKKLLYFLTSIILYIYIYIYIEISLLKKFKTDSYCVGGRHYSGTIDKRGYVSTKGTKMLKDNCVNCKRNNSMSISDATIEAEGLKDCFKSVDRATVNFGNKVSNNPVRALEKVIKIGSAAACRNPKATLAATPDLMKFATISEGIKVVQKGRVLYLVTKKR